MIEFFLKRTAFTNLCTIILFGMGLYQFATVKREAFPAIRFDVVTIRTVYPGASSEEVERFVTNPIEDQLRGVNNIDQIESFSIDSVSVIVLRLDEGLRERQVDRAINDIQQAVNRVPDLPKEVDRPIVEELSSDHPLIALSVVGGSADIRYRLAEELMDALEDLPGVSRIIADGRPPREIWVEADLASLAQRELSLGEISHAIAARNVNLTAGTVEMESQEVQVRTLGNLWTAEDVGNVILRSNDRRELIRVKDVARVQETFEDDNLLVRVNGQPAIILRVKKQRKADAITVAEHVREIKRQFAPQLAVHGMSLVESDDISFFIKRRLNVMKNNMLFGAFFIIAAMLLFLDWRLAIVASIGIPLSLATAFAIGMSLGVTLNLLSVMAFIIVLGMLNDDAVVVADNIYRHLQMGKPRMQAALDGTREVVKPVLGAILTSCAAFLPFALVTGIMGKFMVIFPIIVVLCLLSSLLEAFFILPAHALDITRLGGTFKKSASTGWYAVLLSRYRQALSWSLNHRLTFLGIVLLFVVGIGLLAAWRLERIMFPPGLIDQFFVQVEMPAGTTLRETSAALKQIEGAVLKLPADELNAVTATVGLTGIDETLRRGTHLAQAHVYLTPQDRRERHTDESIQEVRRRIGKIRGVHKLTFAKRRPGPPVGKAVLVRIRGKDVGTLAAIAGQYKKFLRDIPGVSDVKDSLEEDKRQLIINPRPVALAYAGLDATTVSRHLLSAFHGLEATKIRRATEEVVVRVKLAPESQPDRAISQLLVPNVQGRPVPLGRLVRLKDGQGEEYIAHYNYRRAVVVSADVDNVTTTSLKVNEQLKESFKDLPSRFPGYEAIYGGEEKRSQESFRSLLRAFPVALLLNLAILTAIFESWIQPLLIGLTIPIGLVGVACALLVHGQPISFMALLGAVAMTGVVVNNSIVLVDFVNRLREQGYAVREALVEAGAVRLRPILASSITTLLCLFPTAYGWGGKEPFVQPIALSMAWGLTFATPLTLFIIPLAYSVMEDIQQWVAGLPWGKRPERTRSNRQEKPSARASGTERHPARSRPVQ